MHSTQRSTQRRSKRHAACRMRCAACSTQQAARMEKKGRPRAGGVHQSTGSRQCAVPLSYSTYHSPHLSGVCPSHQARPQLAGHRAAALHRRRVHCMQGTVLGPNPFRLFRLFFSQTFAAAAAQFSWGGVSSSNLVLLPLSACSKALPGSGKQQNDADAGNTEKWYTISHSIVQCL